jgi:hypothetical protein
MKKNILRIAAMLILAGFFACEKKEPVATNSSNFLVDKIYDYNDNLIAQFFYNENNQLTKALWNTHYDEFIYKNGRVKDIVRTVTAENYVGDITINLYYDVLGRIIKVGYNGAEPLNTYSYLPNDKIKLGGEVEYDANSNIVRLTTILKNPDPMFGESEEYEWTGTYEYDNKPKPDFGIGNVFVYSPLPCYGNEAYVINNLSTNNITKFSVNGQVTDRYIYEYNEDGLPISVETRWQDIETLEPMVWKLKYKKTLSTD